MTENTIHTIPIKKIIKECKGIKTFTVNARDTRLFIKEKPPKPGQFVMIWVPGIDEVPMSLSDCNEKGEWSFTVKTVGDCTSALNNLNEGDYIGIRGPFGNGFSLPDESIKTIFLIGGGVGIAPLKWLFYKLEALNKSPLIIQGAKSLNELVSLKKNETSQDSVINAQFCTDDGSLGNQESASEAFQNLILNYPKDKLLKSMAYSCGPELMLYKIFQICEEMDILLEASLERIMRCGCGLCGLCAIDPLGLLVCKDGPVFSSHQLRNMKDFGHFKRDFTGKKIPLR